MIDQTLITLETWYREPSEGNDRTKLLSKLAVLELCGWLEVEIDRIILESQAACLNDADWTRTEVIDRTNGFAYDKHFRPMIVRVFGEHLTRKAEANMEAAHFGELERLKSLTGNLWKLRCGFAHADVHANARRQARFDAPSWSQMQLRSLQRIMANFEAVLKQTAAVI